MRYSIHYFCWTIAIQDKQTENNGHSFEVVYTSYSYGSLIYKDCRDCLAIHSALKRFATQPSDTWIQPSLYQVRSILYQFAIADVQCWVATDLRFRGLATHTHRAITTRTVKLSKLAPATFILSDKTLSTLFCFIRTFFIRTLRVRLTKMLRTC